MKETGFLDLKILIPIESNKYVETDNELFNGNQLISENSYFNYVQENCVYTKKKGTIRAFGYQKKPFSQTKLVNCLKGSIFDVVIDLRENSSTYTKSFSIELSDKNNWQLLIPKGFAHGYCSLTDDVMITYKVDEYYNPSSEITFSYCDSFFDIMWPVENPILGKRDRVAKNYKEILSMSDRKNGVNKA